MTSRPVSKRPGLAPARLGRWYAALQDKVWSDPPGASAFYRSGLKLLRLVIAVLRDMSEVDFDERAASLSYTTLLGFAPLLAVTFSVLKTFGAHEALEPFLRSFLEPLGAGAGEATRRLLDVAGNIQLSVLGSLGAAMLLYGLGAMMHKIERAFNDIWRVTEKRSFLLRLRNYLSILLVGPGFLAISAGMTETLEHLAFVKGVFHIDLTGEGPQTVFSVLPYLLSMLAFTALYLGTPNSPVRLMPALVAGLVTGTAWKILGKLFGVFVAGSASYAQIYSAFAALVLFMIWIDAGWLVVLAGASLCYYLQNPSNMALPRGRRVVSLRVHEKLALQICVEIGAAFYDGEKPLDGAALAAGIGVPALIAEEIAGELVAAGMLARVSGRERGFIPAKPFDTTKAEDMLAALRAGGEAGSLQFGKISAAPAVAHLLKEAEKAFHKELGKITLKQLCLGSKDA